MKFVIVTVFCLVVAQTFAYPTVSEPEDSTSVESNEENVRAERSAGYGQATGGYGGHSAGGYGGHSAGGYGGHMGHAPVVGHQVHSYGALAPKVQCGQNILLGCAPTVAKVPCIPSHGGHGHGYGGHGGYAAPAHGGHMSGGHGGYRAAFDAEEDQVPEQKPTGQQQAGKW